MKALHVMLAVQFVIICALGFLLFDAKHPDRDRERVETALTDIRGALSVGANYTQFQEKVQALAAAVENYRTRGAPRRYLKRYDLSLQLYKDSLEYWHYEMSMAARVDFDDPDRAEATMKRIEKEMKELGVPEVTSKEQLFEKADEVWRADRPAQPKQ
jgi:hypothetical protein